MATTAATRTRTTTTTTIMTTSPRVMMSWLVVALIFLLSIRNELSYQPSDCIRNTIVEETEAVNMTTVDEEQQEARRVKELEQQLVQEQERIQSLQEQQRLLNVSFTSKYDALLQQQLKQQQEEEAKNPDDHDDDNKTSTTTTTTKSLVNFKTCDRTKRPLVTVRGDWVVGMGHRLTQWWFVVHLSIIHGYCICFDTRTASKELWQLVLASVFEECPKSTNEEEDKKNETVAAKVVTTTTTTTTTTTVIDIKTKDVASSNGPVVQLHEKLNTTIWEQYQNFTSNHNTSSSSHDDQLLFTIYPDIPHVWRYELKKEKRGYGDILQFATYLMEPLLEDVVYPYYIQHRKHNTSCFLVNDDADSSTIFNMAIHLRVGDMVIESKQSYWENVLRTMEQLILKTTVERIIEEIHVYFLYYNGGHVMVKHAPETGPWGIWDGKVEDLPGSHSHLAETCSNWTSIRTKSSQAHRPILKCYWKTGIGVSMEESVDAMILADGIYMSGSSFAQMLGMFNPFAHAVRMAAITKELNWNGQSNPLYLTGHAGSLTHPTKYHHVNVDGNLFSEQLAYLNLGQD